MSLSAIGKLLQNMIVTLWPADQLNPRGSFQQRFYLSACVLALAVAVLTIPVSIFSGHWPITYALLGFAALILFQMALLRMGVGLKILSWTLLATVTVFLILTMIVTRDLDPSQLPWLILIPLSARAFTAPRIEDSSSQPTLRVTLIATIVAVVAALVVMILQSLELNFGEPVPQDPLWIVGANLVLFLISALGLIFLYDISARVTIAELQRVRNLMSICAWCRKMSSDGEWITIEDYTAKHTRTDLSHGICPTCSASQLERLAKMRE